VFFTIPKVSFSDLLRFQHSVTSFATIPACCLLELVSVLEWSSADRPLPMRVMLFGLKLRIITGCESAAPTPSSTAFFLNCSGTGPVLFRSVQSCPCQARAGSWPDGPIRQPPKTVRIL